MSVPELPTCVRCGHAFVDHRRPTVCVGDDSCGCSSYQSHAPIASSLREGDRVRVLDRLDAPPPPLFRDAVIEAVTTTHVRLRLEDDRSARSIALSDIEIWLRPR